MDSNQISTTSTDDLLEELRNRYDFMVFAGYKHTHLNRDPGELCGDIKWYHNGPSFGCEGLAVSYLRKIRAGEFDWEEDGDG